MARDLKALGLLRGVREKPSRRVTRSRGEPDENRGHLEHDIDGQCRSES